jgi:hypothetical protein
MWYVSGFYKSDNFPFTYFPMKNLQAKNHPYTFMTIVKFPNVGGKPFFVFLKQIYSSQMNFSK